MKTQLRVRVSLNLCACYFLTQVQTFSSLNIDNIYWVHSLCQGSHITWLNPPANPIIHRWSPELLLVMSPVFSIHVATLSSGKAFWNASGITWEPAASGKPSVMGEIMQLPSVNNYRGLLICQRLFSHYIYPNRCDRLIAVYYLAARYLLIQPLFFPALQKSNAVLGSDPKTHVWNLTACPCLAVLRHISQLTKPWFPYKMTKMTPTSPAGLWDGVRKWDWTGFACWEELGMRLLRQQLSHNR